MTAIVLFESSASGRPPPLFLSSTLPCSESRSARPRCALVLTTVSIRVAESGTGWSNRPTWNIAVRTWRTISSRRDAGTSPDRTAALSASPKNCPLGISTSRPALAALAVLCVAPQSETTNPAKFHMSRSGGQEGAVLAGVVAVEAVVGAHHRADVRVLDRGLEGGEV